MLTILIPISGEGRQFIERGYTFPKPLIELADRPMIEAVVDNLRPSVPHRFIFVCQHAHLQGFALGEVLQLAAPGCRIVTVHGSTAGALCSTLLAVDHLDPDDELVIANGDQIVDVSIDRFLEDARSAAWDGSVMTFPASHPKWSFVREEAGEVVAVAEKVPISRHATTGIYYFRRVAAYLAAAERVLLRREPRNGEYFVAPVFNELILSGAHIGQFPIPRAAMHSLGTPEDVDSFLAAARPAAMAATS